MGKFDFLFISLTTSVALILILLVFSFSFLYSKSIKKYNLTLKHASNVVRVYIIDLEEGKVRYVRHTRLSKIGKEDLSDFYARFQKDEKDSLIKWINDLADEELYSQIPKYKDIHVTSRHHSNSSIHLDVAKINYEKKLIYINSFLSSTTHVKKNKNNGKYNLATYDKFEKALKTSSAIRGMTIAFNFYNKRNINDDIRRLDFINFINIFNSYVTQKRPIIEYGPKCIVLSDFNCSTKQYAMQLISTLQRDIDKYMSLNSVTNIGYGIGICENKYFAKEQGRLLEIVTNLSLEAIKEKESINWYEPSDIPSKKTDRNESYKSEVIRVINEKQLNYYFQPIVCLDNAKVIGYQTFVEVNNNFFDSIIDLKNYAKKTGDGKTLFAMNARSFISEFIQEKYDESIHLFLPVLNSEIGYINHTIKSIPNVSPMSICLVFNDKDLLKSNDNDNDVFISEIVRLKDSSFEVALEIVDNEMILNSNVFKYFDYFFIDISKNLKVKQLSQKVLYDFRGLVEKLLKYEKPIIALNVQAWDSVELMHNLNIKFVTSDCISKKEQNILPINPKIISKIEKLKN